MFLFIPLHSSVANVRRIQTNLIFLIILIIILNTVPIKTRLCSIHDTVVFRNNIEVITYSYGRGNSNFFSRIPFSSYTDMSECRPRRLFFFSASSLSVISVFIHGQISNLKQDLNDSKSFLFKVELLDQTVEVGWLKHFFSLLT